MGCCASSNGGGEVTVDKKTKTKNKSSISQRSRSGLGEPLNHSNNSPSAKEQIGNSSIKVQIPEAVTLVDEYVSNALHSTSEGITVNTNECEPTRAINYTPFSIEISPWLHLPSESPTLFPIIEESSLDLVHHYSLPRNDMSCLILPPTSDYPKSDLLFTHPPAIPSTAYLVIAAPTIISNEVTNHNHKPFSTTALSDEVINDGKINKNTTLPSSEAEFRMNTTSLQSIFNAPESDSSMVPPVPSPPSSTDNANLTSVSAASSRPCWN